MTCVRCGSTKTASIDEICCEACKAELKAGQQNNPAALNGAEARKEYSTEDELRQTIGKREITSGTPMWTYPGRLLP